MSEPPHDRVDNDDGQPRRRASLLTRGVAVAVDLTLTVGAAALIFYLVSLQVPLDTARARTPIALVVALAFGYLVVGRDHWWSPGRAMLRLALARLPGNVPGLLGRRISVHQDEPPQISNDRLARAVLSVTLASVLAVLCLGGALTTTRIFQSVLHYVNSAQPVTGAPLSLTLSALPRALLVGPTRGYVQVNASAVGGEQYILDFYLSRVAQAWRIDVARTSSTPQLANYSLGTRDEEVPTP